MTAITTEVQYDTISCQEEHVHLCDYILCFLQPLPVRQMQYKTTVVFKVLYNKVTAYSRLRHEIPNTKR